MTSHRTRTFALPAPIAAVLAAGAADAGVLHQGRGTVLSVDLEAGRITMTEDADGRQVLQLDRRTRRRTRIVDTEGQTVAPAAMRPGDLIREECRVGAGEALATQIRLLRPAWMESASPEI